MPVSLSPADACFTFRLRTVIEVTLAEIQTFVADRVRQAFAQPLSKALGEAGVKVAALRSRHSLGLDAGRRMPIVAVSFDVIGSTRYMSDLKSPVKVFAAVQSLLPTAVFLAGRAGGEVLEWAGDSITVGFDLPDVRQAMWYAHALRQAVVEVVPIELARRDVPPYEIRLGAAIGEAVLARVGLSEYSNIVAMGRPLERSKELADAKLGLPNRVVVDAAVLQRAVVGDSLFAATGHPLTPRHAGVLVASAVLRSG